LLIPLPGAILLWGERIAEREGKGKGKKGGKSGDRSQETGGGAASRERIENRELSS